MSDPNKHNLVYFEHESMFGLYKLMDEWQLTNEKRLLSTSIHQDNGRFCCIALTNPMEVTLVSRSGNPISVVESGDDMFRRHSLSITGSVYTQR